MFRGKNPVSVWWYVHLSIVISKVKVGFLEQFKELTLFFIMCIYWNNVSRMFLVFLGSGAFFKFVLLVMNTFTFQCWEMMFLWGVSLMWKIECGGPWQGNSIEYRRDFCDQPLSSFLTTLKSVCTNISQNLTKWTETAFGETCFVLPHSWSL